MVRIQKMIGRPSIKKWETVMKCKVDCLPFTLWELERQYPDSEYRMHPFDNEKLKK